MTAKRTLAAVLTLIVVVASLTLRGAAPGSSGRTSSGEQSSVLDFGATGDGTTDDTAAIQKAVDSGAGHLHFRPGSYRVTKPVVIDLAKVGYTSLSGDGVAQIAMDGPGPAFRFVGTHEGTAAPSTVKPGVWSHERTPSVDGIEIVGRHPHASGIEAAGTMQLTLTRVVVRDALHAIHLVKRNRNVIISECHLYDNRGIGVFLDKVNLHQINIANCHISYNDGGGVVVRGSEVRNLQIGTCDIEGNMGGPDSDPTANVLLDSTGGSVAEVAIVGCTIQHSHDAPASANIRINGRSTKRPNTDELRMGNVTIADNVLSDVQVNVDVQDARTVTITGNTMWQGYTGNLFVEGCTNMVVANNVFDRNPRYHYSDGAQARLAVVFSDSSDITIAGNHIYGATDVPAAMVLRHCRRMNVSGCSILDFGRCGLLLDDVSDSRVSDCQIRDDRPEANGISMQLRGGRGNMIVDNLLGSEPKLDGDGDVVKDNVYP